MLTPGYCVLCGAFENTTEHIVIPSVGNSGIISVCADCHDKINKTDVVVVTNGIMTTEIDKIRSAGREFSAVETLTVQMMWCVAVFIRDSHEPELAESRKTSDLKLLDIICTPKHRVVGGVIVPLIEAKPHRRAQIELTPRQARIVRTPQVSFVVTPEMKTRVADMRAAGFSPAVIAKACGIDLKFPLAKTKPQPVCPPPEPPTKPAGRLCGFCKTYSTSGGRVKTGHWVCSRCQRSHPGNVLFARLLS